MNDDETIFIEENGHCREILNLHDRQQSLLLDYRDAPYEIQLLDTPSGQVLARFPYGENEDYEGFSFEVSPRRNYLIIKEIEHGLSADTLYITLYALKAKSALTQDGQVLTSEADAASAAHALQPGVFESYTNPDVVFSNDVDETTLWLLGNRIDHLPVIEAYHYGDSEIAPGGENARRVTLYQGETYPMVPLAPAISERRVSLNLSADKVVQGLEALQRQQHQSLCRLPLPAATLANAVAAMLARQETTEGLCLVHTLVCCARLGANPEGLVRRLALLQLPHQVLSHPDPSLTYIEVSLPLIREPSYAVQSVDHMNQLALEQGCLYSGVCIRPPHALSQWQDALDAGFELYRTLAMLLTDRAVSEQDFADSFHQLLEQHERCDFNAGFSDAQCSALEHISLALSQFDDWEIREEALRLQVAEALGQL